MHTKIYNDINLAIVQLDLSRKRILDVGCGTGLLGRELKKKGNYVFGIDSSEQELAIAKTRLDGTKQLDITSDELNLPGSFDVLIFADILEHLPNPFFVLKRFLPLLSPGGMVIVSVPNVACYSMRLGLLFGQFNYTDFGLLDKTHLRFFTKKTSRQLIQNAGLNIMKISITPYFIRPLFRIWRKIRGGNIHGDTEEKILNSQTFLIYARFVFPIERLVAKICPSLFAYQFVIVAKKITT